MNTGRRFALLLLLALAGCSPRPDGAAAIRQMTQRTLIQLDLNCLERWEQSPSPAQREYLLRLHERDAQRYVLALATGDAVPCLERALQACERQFPGQCVAAPGEIDGRRP